LWGPTSLGALDCERATCSLVGKGAGIVILGPEGEILHSGSDPEKGQFTAPDGEKSPVPWAEIKRGVEPHLKKGLLGGIDLPDVVKPITQAIKNGQLAAAQNMLGNVPDSNAQLGPFKKEVQKRFDELQAKKRAFIDTLDSAGRKWDAYKVAQSYVTCFPKAKDNADVKKKIYELEKDQSVKTNQEAQRALVNILTVGYGPAAKDHTQAKAALEGLAKKYSDTEAATMATAVVNSPPASTGK
jgi:hypothetical protein